MSQTEVDRLMTQRESGVEQAARVLPLRLRSGVMSLPEDRRSQIEELRLRVGLPMAAVLPEGERALAGPPVTQQELEQLLELASRASVHAVLDQLSRGYLTVQGGHRVGLCGSVALEDGAVRTIRKLSSAAVRVARQFPGAAEEVLPSLLEGRRLESALILAPPGLGKTTLLRDLVRAVSAGEGAPPRRVGVADERGEIAALFDGVPQLDVGPRTDVMEGCPKAWGLMTLLRGMNPQVLAVDEITAPEDVAALVSAAGCGVTLLATAHGAGREDLSRRKLYRGLLEEGVFRRLVRIRREAGRRIYEVEVLE